jgi:hypothetical protein
MTWREAQSQLQGQHGFVVLRVSAQGELVDRAPWLLGWALSTLGALSGWTGLQGLVIVRLVGLTPQGGIVNADADVACDASGAYNWARRIGPHSSYAGVDAAIADALKGVAS